MNRPMDISEATSADRSHIERRREILAAHPEVRTLIGRDRTTAWITICVVAGQICLAALFGELGIRYWWLALIGAYAIGAFANHAGADGIGAPHFRAVELGAQSQILPACEGEVLAHVFRHSEADRDRLRRFAAYVGNREGMKTLRHLAIRCI